MSVHKVNASGPGPACFARRLLIERCGPEDQVLKLMPALAIDTQSLEAGPESIYKTMHLVLEQARLSEPQSDTHTLVSSDGVSHVD